VTLCLACAGCSNLWVSTARNLHFEAAECTNDTLERVRNCLVANGELKDVERAEPGHPYSDDYTRGFKAGYMDYLEDGGSGAPPPFPPSRYWAVRYQTPEGHGAIADWYAGFRDGAARARQTGERELVKIPSPLRGSPRPPQEVSPPREDTGGEKLDVLPEPRKMAPIGKDDEPARQETKEPET